MPSSHPTTDGAAAGAAVEWHGAASQDGISADTSPYVHGGKAADGAYANGVVSTCEKALISPEQLKMTPGALVMRGQTPFSGMYEDVNYPITTLYAPPRPPGEMPPRVRRAPRPRTIWKNDLSLAGEREYRAQCTIGKVWRGILCRRRLRQSRLLAEVLSDRARRIQCWWRCLQAKERSRRLAEMKREWAAARAEEFMRQRVENTKNMIYWQRSRFESSVEVIQRVVRWHLNRVHRRQCEEAGLPPSQWPEELPFPVNAKKRPYFPWRHHRRDRHDHHYGMLGKLQVADANAKPQRTILQFRETRDPVPPPTQKEVEEINDAMRRREAAEAAALATPESLSRMDWKLDNLKERDLDFNAGVIQRVYRSTVAKTTRRTEQISKDYYDRAARIIARTFRMYVLIKRMKDRHYDADRRMRRLNKARNEERINELKIECVWQRELMHACATTIQRVWHWYRYSRFGTLPKYYERGVTEGGDAPPLPTPPSYGLIDDYLKRQKELRLSSMNLLDQNREEELHSRSHSRFIPKTIIHHDHVGYYGCKVES